MKIRPHTLVSITLGILLLASTYFVGVTAQVNPYDPWVDYNEDGQIDIFDVVEVATRYDTTGDPTKNVTVINWPDFFTAPYVESAATAAMCAFLDVSWSAYANFDIRRTGKDTNSSTISGMGNSTVRFHEGFLSGGGVLWAQDFETRPFCLAHIPASGFLRIRDSNGTLLAMLALPFTDPVQIDNVDSFEVTVIVPYSWGVFYGPISKEVFAVAGVSYEQLN